MKKRFWLAFVIAVLAGTGLHFLYDVCPVPLVGLFAPVNESVWEHLKLFFWPTLAAAFVLTRKNEDGQRAWSGWLLAELVMPVLCMGLFYMRVRRGGAVGGHCALRAGDGSGILDRVLADRDGAWCVVRRGAGDCGRTLRGGADFVYACAAGTAGVCGMRRATNGRPPKAPLCKGSCQPLG